jgi:hypothetical membrane protein
MWLAVVKCGDRVGALCPGVVTQHVATIGKRSFAMELSSCFLMLLGVYHAQMRTDDESCCACISFVLGWKTEESAL